MARERPHINLVFIGHVDHGKSTTVGRLLYDAGTIDEQTMRKLKDRAKELGKSGFEFAFVMDTLKEEQERGVTIDLAHKKFETSNELSAHHFPDSVSVSTRMRLPTEFPEEGFHLESYVENLQKGFLEEALRRTNGVQVKAAELLRMSYRSFRHYMHKYNIPS